MFDAHTSEGVREANADETRDYAAELRAVPTRWEYLVNAASEILAALGAGDLTPDEAVKAWADARNVPPAMTPAERANHPFAAGLLDADAILRGGK